MAQPTRSAKKKDDDICPPDEQTGCATSASCDKEKCHPPWRNCHTDNGGSSNQGSGVNTRKMPRGMLRCLDRWWKNWCRGRVRFCRTRPRLCGTGSERASRGQECDPAASSRSMSCCNGSISGPALQVISVKPLARANHDVWAPNIVFARATATTTTMGAT